MVNIQHGKMLKQEPPQGSILGPLLFLIYINDLPKNLVSKPNLFDDDTLLFSVMRNKQLSTQNLNEDLDEINQWFFNGKWVLILITVNKLRKLSFLIS